MDDHHNDKALLVNLPEEVAENLIQGLEEAARSIQCYRVASVGDLREPYDFVFVMAEENLSQVRSALPLAELFVLTSKRDYQVAVKALRVGARDLIPLPIDSRELGVAVQTAQALNKARQHPVGALAFLTPLHYFGDIRKFTTFRQVFEATERYITTQFPVNRVGLFHYHFGEKRGQFDCESSGQIKLSEEELYAIATGQKRYGGDGEHLYLSFMREGERAYFLFCELDESFELAQFNYFFDALVFAIGSCYGYVKQYQAEKRMSSLAHTDEVTGLYNQRRLYQDIDASIREAQQNQGYFSLVFLDLDKFKDVNDEYGHIIGSKLLMQVAGVIRQVIRETDYIYRYGGDEFVMILPHVRARDAQKIGQRLLHKMREQDFVAGSDQTFRLGLSLGIAEYPRDAQSREDILAMADKMMYEAKKLAVVKSV